MRQNLWLHNSHQNTGLLNLPAILEERRWTSITEINVSSVLYKSINNCSYSYNLLLPSFLLYKFVYYFVPNLSTVNVQYPDVSGYRMANSAYNRIWITGRPFHYRTLIIKLNIQYPDHYPRPFFKEKSQKNIFSKTKLLYKTV
jgi:hypothetical protein